MKSKPVAEVLGMLSVATTGSPARLGFRTVRNVLANPYYRGILTDPYYKSLMHEMASRGWGANIPPVHLGRAERIAPAYDARLTRMAARSRGMLMLGNGHHRLAIAIALGIAQIPYSYFRHLTGDDWSD